MLDSEQQKIASSVLVRAVIFWEAFDLDDPSSLLEVRSIHAKPDGDRVGIVGSEDATIGCHDPIVRDQGAATPRNPGDEHSHGAENTGLGRRTRAATGFSARASAWLSARASAGLSARTPAARSAGSSGVAAAGRASASAIVTSGSGFPARFSTARPITAWPVATRSVSTPSVASIVVRAHAAITPVLSPTHR
jgi:hypothetical protein